MRALLQEYFADKELARGDLHETSLQCQFIVASDLCIFGGFLRNPYVRKSLVLFEKGVDSRDLCRGNSIDEGDAAWQTCFRILLD